MFLARQKVHIKRKMIAFTLAKRKYIFCTRQEINKPNSVALQWLARSKPSKCKIPTQVIGSYFNLVANFTLQSLNMFFRAKENKGSYFSS